MYKNLLVLPDGTEIFSGSGTKNAIKSIKSTRMVNNGDELTIGSACSNMIEVSLFTPGGDLDITAGNELAHYKVDDSGARVKIGLFTVEEPTRPTANTLKLVGYDRVSKLDKDLTSWLDSLDGWPYSVNAFASMVCQACGVTFVEQSGLPNGDFSIRQWKKSGATGRKIMRWLGEIVCRYVYADQDGKIRFGWYKDTGKSYGPTGDNYYFAGSLTYENYQVAPVQAVQIRLADNDSGAVWPNVPDGTNAYIITGNPILTAYVTEGLLPHLDVIAGELARVTYTPCEVGVRASLDVNAGDIIHITDKNGKTFSTYVMSKITSGQRDTLSGTGSHRRDSTTAANNRSEADKMAETEALANSAQNAANAAQKDANEKKRVFVSQPVPPYSVGDLWAQGGAGDLMRCKTERATGAFVAGDWELATKYIDEGKAGTVAQNKVNAQTQTDIFNKLTNNGALQGLYMKDGELYISASYLATGVLASKDGKTFYLDLDQGVLKGKFQELSISGKTVDTIAQEKANAAEGNAKTYADTAASNAVSAQTQTDIFNKLTNNGALPGLFMLDGQMYINADYIQSGTIDASVVNVKNLIAEAVKSQTDESVMKIDGASLSLQLEGIGRTFILKNWSDGTCYLSFFNYDANGSILAQSQLGARRLFLGGVSNANPAFSIQVDEDNSTIRLKANGVSKKISWKDNGDGTFTLIGK